jgi:PAS domain S-box-containing protein
VNNPQILTSWSIRKKLLLLILVVLLPASGIIVSFGLGHRRQEIREIERKALLVVQSMTTQQEQVARGTEQLLSILAQFPDVQRLDAKACNELFRELQNRHPFLSIITAVTPDGNMFAASEPFPPGSVNISDRKHVKDAIKSLGFSAGAYQVGRVSKIKSISYAYPVLDANKNLIAILTAGFNLDEYARFVKKADLPEGFAVVIIDHDGVRLYRFPENDETSAGKPIPRDSFKQVSGDIEQGTFERIAEDGTYRVYGFKQMRLRKDLPPYLYMLVGIAKDEVLHKANLELLSSLSLLGIAAGIAIFLAWALGNFAFIRPINDLVTAARRFGKNEIGVRTGLPHTPDELGQLASSFDDMAELIDMRTVERKQSEEKVASQNQFLNTILESLPHPFYVLDAHDYTIKMANTAAAPGGLAPGTTCHALTHKEDKPCQTASHLCPLEIIKRTKQPVITEHIHFDKEGNPRHVEVHGNPILDISGNVEQIIEYNFDITERKQMEEALRTARDELEIRVKERTAGLITTIAKLERVNQELRDFAFIASHDLQEPLRKIQTFGSMLSPTALDITSRGYLDRMLNSASRMRQLLKGLLQYSRVADGPEPFTKIDIGESVREAADVFELEIKKTGGRIEIEDLPIIEADESQMFCLFENLIGNALKFRGDANPLIKVYARCDGHGSCDIFVKDNGIGFEQQFAERIFKPFQRLHGRSSQYGGTGMGLAICRKIVEQHGGNIRAESEPGKGTTLVVRLPVKQARLETV